MKMDQNFWQQLSALLDQKLEEKLDQKLDEKLAPLLVRMERIDQRLETVDQRLEGVDQRLEVIDQRLEGVDQRLDKVEERLNKVEEKLGLHYQYFIDMMAAIGRLEFDMQIVKMDIAVLNENLEDHYVKITQITRNLPAIRDDIQILYTRVTKLEKIR